MRRLVSVSGKRVDCGAPKGCILGAGNVSNFKEANGQKIFFDPKIPPKVEKITVTPDTKLADHQIVTVSGTGFPPSTYVNIAQCVTHPPAGAYGGCDYATTRSATVAANDTFSAHVTLERLQVLYTTKSARKFIDCAYTVGTCEIRTFASGLGGPSKPLTAPLGFNPYIKRAVNTAQLSPATPLTDLEAVTVSAAGFTPGYGVGIVQCLPASPAYSKCDFTTTRTVTAGPKGAFTFTDYVRRSINPGGTANSTDCAANPGACELLLLGTPSQPPVHLKLTFDPNTPAVPITINASPNTGLGDNQEVTVTVGGFTPYQQVQITECSAEALTNNNLSYCDATTTQTITPTAPTATQTHFVVRSAINAPDGLVDCTSAAGACVLVATNGYYGSTQPFASTSLTFGP